MKRAILFFGIILSGLTFAQQTPKVLKTLFTKEALAQKITAENGDVMSIKDVFSKHKGKVIVLDLWAGWCRDCILALPKAEELEKIILRFILYSFHWIATEKALTKALKNSI
jgi:thiol-disulfide isomerase/thioredoxin